MNISQITRKFYKSEEERIRKLEENMGDINILQDVIGFDMENLYKNKIRLMIVNIDPVKLSINAVMTPCCGSSETVPSEIRKSIEEKIITQTKFKEVIWEL